ncbi:MAG TPA: bifunctional phosphoribosyl-AMP cyclohydrolase/phosphoribosyl-ATP diphosphatase HisIE [Polyangiaceae bacterium]|nr:bifunctional phosphoribosyl-AMP cyclohydrolase/phosphoribosyl-ATP diphosphatase HisIE [Polyangiaceae bacterium]
MTLHFNEQGLIPALAQDRFDGQVRMLAWMNREALQRTLETGLATFFSRSRGKIWVKGEGSGNVLRVHSVTADCDADTLLLLVEPAGPSCHTGRPSCFFRQVQTDGNLSDLPFEVAPFISELERTIRERQASTVEKSYTKSLLAAGIAKINAKISEEAGELVAAFAEETDERVLSETADLLFHVLVGLRARGLDFRQVVESLASRTKQSGHEEKLHRKNA